jgi:hypothetical protein
MTSENELRVVGALRDQIRQTALPTEPPQRLIWRRPGLIAGTAVALAAITVAVLLAFGATSTPPAYAIARHRDGQVTITLNLITSIGALNDKMEAMGLPIRAVPALKGCDAPVRIIGPDHEPTGPAKTLIVHPDGTHDGRPSYGRVVAVTVLPPVDPDRTLVLAAGKVGFFYLAGQTVQGPPPACFGISSHGPDALLPAPR